MMMMVMVMMMMVMMMMMMIVFAIEKTYRTNPLLSGVVQFHVSGDQIFFKEISSPKAQNQLFLAKKKCSKHQISNKDGMARDIFSWMVKS